MFVVTDSILRQINYVREEGNLKNQTLNDAIKKLSLKQGFSRLENHAICNTDVDNVKEKQRSGEGNGSSRFEYNCRKMETVEQDRA